MSESITNPAVRDMLAAAGWIATDPIEAATAGDASREEWATFAATLGITVEDSAKRDEIRALVEQLLEQPDDSDTEDSEDEA